MLIANLKKTCAVAIVLGLVATSTVLFARQREEPPAVPAIVDEKPVTVDRLPKRKPGPYVVEPPDLIIVEVLETLPGRPISGERLVRPDGTISLGFYGDIYVAGLTISEVKEKVIEHLRTFLTDEILGLFGPDDDGKEIVRVEPKDSNAVFVDVGSYNSKVYYVDGEVNRPGRYPVTGNETVRDAIHNAEILMPATAPGKVRLIRPLSRDHAGAGREVAVEIDYQQLLLGTEPSINYQLEPGDRIIVLHDPKARSSSASPASTASALRSAEMRSLEERVKSLEKNLQRENNQAIDTRLDKLETTLSQILEELRELKNKPRERPPGASRRFGPGTSSVGRQPDSPAP